MYSEPLGQAKKRLSNAKTPRLTTGGKISIRVFRDKQQALWKLNSEITFFITMEKEPAHDTSA